MSFNMDNKLVFIGSLQFQSFSLGHLVKNLGIDDFKYLSQGFDSDILYLIKQKEFHPYEYISSFGKFKERLPRKESFYSLLTDKRISDNHYKNVLKVWDRFEMTAMKDYYD